jgi:two-component system, chemotaxis family, chemotaxis protein CheY
MSDSRLLERYTDMRPEPTEGSPAGEPQTRPPPRSPSSEACSILVVDDDADVREALAQALEADGHAVVVACDGLEAIERLSQIRRPCLVFLDLCMPRMDGLGLLHRMRANPALQAIPVCVLTAEMCTSVQGAQHLMSKPLDVAALLRVVDRHCSQRAKTNWKKRAGAPVEGR